MTEASGQESPPQPPPPPAWPPPPPPPPAWPPPPPSYSYPPARPSAPHDGRATGSLVCGLLSVAFCWTGLAGMVLGPFGYFLGRSSVKRIEESKGTIGGHGMATAGYVLGLIGTSLGSITLFTLLVIIQLGAQSAGQ